MPAQPVAGFTPDQLSAFQGVQNIQGAANPFFNQAYSEALQAASPLTGGTVEQYMNPFIGDVTKNLQDIFGAQRQDLYGRLTQAAGGNSNQRISDVSFPQLAKQQGLAAGQTYAGMYNQAAQQAQTDAARQLQAAGFMGNLGPLMQQTGLQGLQALLGTGGMQQQLSQAQQQSLYNLLQNQFGFGFQRPQYEAGILGALGPLAGGTTTGQGTSTTTYPPPSALSQILGGGIGLAGLTGGLKGGGAGGGLGGFGGIGNALSGLGSGLGSALGGLGEGIGSALSFLPLMFSDKRLKENVKEVGRLHDGQKIYRYNFKGDPRTQVGLLSQEVERHHPEAVHKVGGLGTVDYDAATEDAVQHRQLGGAADYMQSSVVPAMQLAMHAPQFPRLDLRLEHAKQAEDPMADFKKLGLSMLGRQRPSGGSPTSDEIDEGPVGGEAAPEYSAQGGPVRAMGGQVFGNLPGGFSDGMGANMPGMQGTGIMPFMQAAQMPQMPSASNLPTEAQAPQAPPFSGMLPNGMQFPSQAQQAPPFSGMPNGIQSPSQMQSWLSQMMGHQGWRTLMMRQQQSPQSSFAMPQGASGGAVSPFQAFQGYASGGDVDFEGRFPSEDRTTDASGMSASKGPQMPIIRNPRELRAALERQIPAIQGRRLGRALENFQFGGGTGFDPSVTAGGSDLLYPDDYNAFQSPVNLGGSYRDSEKANAFANPDQDNPVNSIIPVGAKPTASVKPPERSEETGPYDKYRYPGAAKPPADWAPYPRSRERDWGSNISESPWSALARAGFAMMAGTSPYAGVNIGRGALEGIKGLEEQRSSRMKEEEVNQQAQRLWQQMQQHADQYKYMTPAQIATANLAERKMAEKSQEITPAGLLVKDPSDPTKTRLIPWDQLPNVAGAGNVPDIEAKPGVPPKVATPPDQPAPKQELGADVPTMPRIPPSASDIVKGSAQHAQQVGVDILKKADAAASAASSSQTMLEQTERALNEIPKSGILTAGPGAASRAKIVSYWNTLMDAANRPQDKVKPEAVGDIEELRKLTTRMGFELARTLGTREAMQIVQQATAAVPGIENTPLGAKKIMAGMRAAIDQQIAWNNFAQRWADKRGGNMFGAREYFNKMRPSSYWNAKAWTSLVPETDRQALFANKDNPEARDAIDKKYGPGVSKYMLDQQFGSE